MGGGYAFVKTTNLELHQGIAADKEEEIGREKR